jgi:hypothetical protein
MRSLLLGMLCTSMLMACEDYPEIVTSPIDIPLGVKPGTRLSPKLLLADDGTMFLHPTIWKDSEFGECVFRTAADGKHRCLPDGTLQPEPLYIDTGCTQRAFYQPVKTCPASSTILVRTVAPALCNLDGEWSVFPVKETIEKGTLFRTAGAGAACVVAINVDSPDQGTIVVLDNEIQASEFVSAWR